MAKRSNFGNEPVPIPKGSTVDRKGYVYYAVQTMRTPYKDKPGTYPDHKRREIGKVVTDDPKDWKSDQRMYPNKNYIEIFETRSDNPKEVEVRDPNNYMDHVSVGLYAVVFHLAVESGLLNCLIEVFGEIDAYLILDLAQFMIASGTAVFQRFTHWARSHAVFSNHLVSDTEISNFINNDFSVTKINHFKKLWAKVSLGDGRVDLDYDSTNVGGQAEGIAIEQKGHAKDDPSMNQVNIEYVIRQEDGLPVSFSEYPGSITDIKQAKDMIRFLGSIMKELHPSGVPEEVRCMIIADRGYISESNVKELDEAGIDFLMLLRRNLGIAEKVISENLDNIRRSENYLSDLDKYAYTVQGPLFDGDTKTRYFHIIWDSDLESAHRKSLYALVAKREQEVKVHIDRKKQLTEDELKKFRQWFDLTLVAAGETKVKKRGSGKGYNTVPTYVVVKAERRHDLIDVSVRMCGYMVFATSRKMTAAEALTAYSRRDGIEKVFSTLKSRLGMDKFGVHSDNALRGKSIAWFAASILYSLLQTKSKPLRVESRKSYTTPCIIEYLEEFEADLDIETRVYTRRYLPYHKQEKVMNCMGITIEDIDNCIEKFSKARLKKAP